MSRDRLAAIRNQRQGDEFSQPQSSYQSSPQPPRGGLPTGPRGGGARPSQDGYNNSQYPPQSASRPLNRQASQSMEMREVKGPARDSIVIGGGGVEIFFENISKLQSRIRELSNSIHEFDSLQSRLSSLPASAEPTPEQIRLSQQITNISTEIRNSTNKIKASITRLVDETKKLAKTPGAITQEDVDLRTNQIKTLQKRFVSVVEEYAAVEKKGRDATKKKLERQVLVVNPNLSDSEVKQVVDDAVSGQTEGIFSQALMSSSQRLGQANSVLSDVRSRQQDIQRIETTLIELAQMFNDMAILIDQQDVQIRAIEETVINVNSDMEKGVQELKSAVVSARGARKKRIWCCIIFLIIVAVIAGVVAFEVLKNKGSSSSSSSSN